MTINGNVDKNDKLVAQVQNDYMTTIGQMITSRDEPDPQYKSPQSCQTSCGMLRPAPWNKQWNEFYNSDYGQELSINCHFCGQLSQLPYIFLVSKLNREIQGHLFNRLTRRILQWNHHQHALIWHLHQGVLLRMRWHHRPKFGGRGNESNGKNNKELDFFSQARTDNVKFSKYLYIEHWMNCGI